MHSPHNSLLNARIHYYELQTLNSNMDTIKQINGHFVISIINNYHKALEQITSIALINYKHCSQIIS